MRPDASELRLRVRHAASGAPRWLHLHGGWADMLAAPGDTLNVVLRGGHSWMCGADGARHASFTCGKEGLVVHHPDLLLSGTAVSTALRCPRQAMLADRGVGGPGKAACLGTLMHVLVQAALAAVARGTLSRAGAGADGGPRRPQPAPRRALAVVMMHKHAGQFACSLTFAYRRFYLGPGSPVCDCEACLQALLSYEGEHLSRCESCAGTAANAVHLLQTDVRVFMLARIPALLEASAMELAEAGVSQREAATALRDVAPRLAGTVATHFRGAGRGERGGATSAAPVSLEGLLDIEECVWAPKYGIKGVIDATMLARYPPEAAGGAGHGQRSQQAERLGLVPVEFKSGKRYHSHAAQVRLLPSSFSPFATCHSC
jgi:DNA replication factor Dna2